jgi:hypothetical protein
MGGNSNPLIPFTDLRGVDGFVPLLCGTGWEFGFGLYVTGREDDAVEDWAAGRYDILYRGV